MEGRLLWILKWIFLINTIFTPADGISEIFLAPARCGSTEPASVGMIIRSSTFENYTLPAGNCSLVMTALTPAHRLRFEFNTGNGDIGVLNNPSNNPPSCSGSSIEIFDGRNTSSRSLTNSSCGNFTSTEILSTGDSLTLLILTDGNDTFMNFTAHYTSFIESSNCSSDFPCSNGRCISTEMVCDSTRINNCGDFSDNFAGPPGNCSTETTTTAAVTSTAQSSTAEITTTTLGGLSSSGVDNATVLYAVLGVIGGLAVLLIHWMLFKPRWLVWKMCWVARHGCYRSLANCFGRNVVDSSPSLDRIPATSETERRHDSPKPSSPVPSRESVRTDPNLSDSPFVRGIAKENHIFTVHH